MFFFLNSKLFMSSKMLQFNKRLIIIKKQYNIKEYNKVNRSWSSYTEFINPIYFNKFYNFKFNKFSVYNCIRIYRINTNINTNK